MAETVKKFNDAGLTKVKNWFKENMTKIGNRDGVLSQVPIQAFTTEVCKKESLTEDFDPNAKELDITGPDANNAINFAQYFIDLFKDCDPNRVATDGGMWTWLSIRLLVKIAPADNNGDRVLGETNRWIYTPNDMYDRKGHRHIIRNKYIMLKAIDNNKEMAPCFISGKAETGGEMIEQVVSRQDIISSLNILKTIYKLFWDPKTKKLKPGSRDAVREFVKTKGHVLGLLSQSWHIYDCEPEEIIKMIKNIGGFEKFL